MSYKQKAVFTAIIVFTAMLLVGCAPKIIGKQKHRRSHNCGCASYQAYPSTCDSTVAIKM